MDSTANRLDDHVPEVLNEVVRGKLRMFDVSSGENERKILCKGDTPEMDAAFIVVPGKVCCWQKEDIVCNDEDGD